MIRPTAMRIQLIAGTLSRPCAPSLGDGALIPDEQRSVAATARPMPTAAIQLPRTAVLRPVRPIRP